MFALRLGDVLVDDGQLLFQSSDDQVLAPVVFGRRCEVFRCPHCCQWIASVSSACPQG